jgi:hypothetical protein
MFPRIVLHDARGTFVSLSHFCPTAARLLFDAPGDGTIVPAPAALANIGELDGLDARGEWPPLLRARVMMDPDSFAAWERRSVSLLTRATISADTALAELQDVTARICKWAPGGAQLLQDVVHTAFDRHDDDSAHGTVMPVEEIALKRWLAARLFGAWTTYQGDGLATTLRYLRACLDTFRRERDVDGDALEAVRRSDLDMLHSDRSLKR